MKDIEYILKYNSIKYYITEANTVISLFTLEDFSHNILIDFNITATDWKLLLAITEDMKVLHART